MRIFNEKELGEALKKGQDCIEIEHHSGVGKSVLRIKATGKVAWAVCIGFVAVSVTTIMATPVAPPAAVAGTTMGLVAAPVAVATLGTSAAASAIAVAVAGGGVGALNKLRKYKMVKRDGKIILFKKS